jgi:hypothetical protein
MKFDYARYRGPGPSIVRPIIPVLIHNPQAGLDEPIRSVICEALVDSGSDFCIFPSELGEMIGIDVEKGSRKIIGGVVAGESRPVYFHIVDLSIEEGRRFEAWVGFMPDLSRNGHGILGRHSFFSHFTFVTFREHKHELEIGKWRRGA